MRFVYTPIDDNQLYILLVTAIIFVNTLRKVENYLLTLALS